MKRLIVAASLAALAGSSFALEIGKPFEQTELDRVLPNIQIRGQSTQLAAAGATRSDAVNGADEAAQSPFAHQFDVITPAP